jgi:SAM-dependent methyltransferase
MTQDAVFAGGEGDRWFRRNQAALTSPERLARDPVLKLVGTNGLVPKDVLEVGASNGYRLEALRARLGCRAVAVELSEEAIRDGRARYPSLEFRSGTAAALPVSAGSLFDLVIVNFVLHWVDRSTLLASLAEIDRVVRDHGHVIVGDFAPASPERVPYHHLPGGDVWTFKQNYVDVLLASNLYELVACFTYEAGTLEHKVGVLSDRRCAVALLQKTLFGRYAVRQLPDETADRR